MAQNKKKTPQKTASGKKAGDSRRQEPERSFNGRVTAGVILIILGIITAIGYFLDKSEGGKLVGLLCGLLFGGSRKRRQNNRENTPFSGM